MNYEKSIPVPREARRVLRFPVSRLRAGDAVRDLYLLHVKEGPRGFECAEGLVPTTYGKKPPKTPTELYSAPNETFAVYTGTDGKRHLYAYGQGRDFSDMEVGSVRHIAPVSLSFADPLLRTWYVVTYEKTWRCGVEEDSTVFDSGREAMYGTEYAGRFFLLGPRRLSYTKPYTRESWRYIEDGTLQQDGYIEIPPRCGDYVGGALFDERLFLFARSGVVEVTMGGKTLGGKTRYIPQACGETIPGTIQTIGSTAYFFTEKGLCTFDGENFKRIATPCSRRIDFSAACKTGVWRGKYYAFAALDNGARRVYVYDPEAERETFLLSTVESFCAGVRAAALKAGVLYELADKVLPENGDPCSICCRIDVGAGKTVRVDWIRIEGEGEFEAELSTPFDGAARAHGAAGKKLPLSRALFGAELTVNISTRSADFCVTAIAVGLGEGTDDD